MNLLRLSDDDVVQLLASWFHLRAETSSDGIYYGSRRKDLDYAVWICWKNLRIPGRGPPAEPAVVPQVTVLWVFGQNDHDSWRQ